MSHFCHTEKLSISKYCYLPFRIIIFERRIEDRNASLNFVTYLLQSLFSNGRLRTKMQNLKISMNAGHLTPKYAIGINLILQLD